MLIRTLVLGISATVCALTPMTAGATAGGALAAGHADITLCVPHLSPSHDMTHASDRLENRSGHDVRIRSVRLVHPHDIELIDSWKTDAVGASPGTFSRWPLVPRSELQHLRRVPANTTVYPVFHLRSLGADGSASFDGVELTYTDRGTTRHVTTPVDVTWVRDCSKALR